MSRYADKPSLMKYINIAGMLPNKTARDIALRCHWMMPVSRRSLPVYVKDPAYFWNLDIFNEWPLHDV